MDQLQTHMVTILARIPRQATEAIDCWLRRRGQAARNLSAKIGFWSEFWAQRCIDWQDHVMRHPGALRNLLLTQNFDWLHAQRSRFVPADGSASTRNSLLAGRTGTRAIGGKPQVRWDAGIALARSFLNSRSDTLIGSNALSVSSRIRAAVAEISQFFIGHDP